MKNELLKVIVGSQAHGLAGPESDIDYRSVYALPTEEILSLGYKYKGASWVEGDTEDNTAWEIGHFLSLAFQCNPTILEVFLSPIVSATHLDLRYLFKYIWTPKKSFDAFVGYGKNQQKKFLDKKDNRPHKYAAAHIRTLTNLNELLTTGTFTVRIADLAIGEYVRKVKAGNYTIGEVVDITEQLTEEAKRNLERCPFVPLSEDERYGVVNDYLLKIRREFLSGV